MSVFSETKRLLFGPKTVFVCKITNPCPVCEGTEVISEMYVDSDGQPEMMVVKCQKCGPIKNLYAGHRMRPQPRFERNYAEALIGEFRKPKLKKEI